MSYWNPAGRLVVGATLLLPSTAVGVLYLLKKGKHHEHVVVTNYYRYALLLHAAYFVSCILSFEILIDLDPMATTGTVPENPDNLFWQMTCLSGELFFVAVVAMGLMAGQPTLPRWSLLVPLAQTSYNLKNSLIWCLLYPIFSPVGKPIELMRADFCLIAPLAATYVYHYFTAPTSQYQAIE